MGNRSVETKHSTEIGGLAAWLGVASLPENLDRPVRQWIDPQGLLLDSTLDAIQEVLPQAIANPKHRALFRRSHATALSFRPVIERDLASRGLTLPQCFDWQGDFNRNDNGCPADTVWPGHEIGGIGFKNGSHNLLNLGNTELLPDYQDGDDVFEKLAPKAWALHWRQVKQDLLAVCQDSRDSNWSKNGTNKYAISLVSGDRVKLTHHHTQHCVIDIEQWLDHQEPKAYRRITGDFYQANKKSYGGTTINNDLVEGTTRPIVEFLRAFDTKRLGAFDRKGYYFLDVGPRPELYFVPPADQVEVELVEIIMPESGVLFGTGITLTPVFKIKGKDMAASVEFRPRYHTGTFVGSALMIQNLKGKQYIWQRLERK